MELLIVVAIIAILAAIAVPQFSAYRKRGYAAMVTSDAKNAYTIAQGYLIGNPGAVLNDCVNIISAGYQQSAGTTCTAANFQETAGNITITGSAGWGLSVNTATINFDGNLTPAKP